MICIDFLSRKPTVRASLWIELRMTSSKTSPCHEWYVEVLGEKWYILKLTAQHLKAHGQVKPLFEVDQAPTQWIRRWSRASQPSQLVWPAKSDLKASPNQASYLAAFTRHSPPTPSSLKSAPRFQDLSPTSVSLEISPTNSDQQNIYKESGIPFKVWNTLLQRVFLLFLHNKLLT